MVSSSKIGGDVTGVQAAASVGNGTSGWGLRSNKKVSLVLPTDRFICDRIFATRLFFPRMHLSARSVYSSH